jgi:hypothetical protein
VPRLRHYKNYNFTVKDLTDNNENLDADSLSDENQDSERGNHWLSDSRIISSLPNEQINQAIKYHQVQINLLQNELCARENGLRTVSPFFSGDTSFDPATFTLDYSQTIYAVTGRKSRSLNQGVRKKQASSKSDKTVSKAVKLLKKLGISREELEALWQI